ncbi:MAG: TrkA family potassium uptake protein [Treponemataceae bacterium]|nr:TrkA family potassium uptake protein [Treponemataceae bacterium]
MVTIAIVGMGTFGCRVVNELEDADADVVIIDKDRDIVEAYKGKVKDAYITDALNDSVLKKTLPDDVDTAVVDLGQQLETSILVTNTLHKMGIKKIIVKARSDEHGDILRLVGATDIVFPDLEAALHIVPMIVTPSLYNYMQVSEKFALAEVAVRSDLQGKTLAECGLRQNYKLNLVAVRSSSEDEYQLANNPTMVLKNDLLLLVAGTTEDLHKYVEEEKQQFTIKKSSFARMFKKRPPNVTNLVKKLQKNDSGDTAKKD